MHADQQAIVFRPGAGNTNKVVFGTDGGVYYSDNITTAGSSTSNITSRNQDYNVVQFYYGAIDGVDFGDGDDFSAGSQDNGTQFALDTGAGANTFFDPVGGDGAYTEIDDSGQYSIQTYTFNSHRYINYPTISAAITLGTQGPDAGAPAGTANTSNGNFINEAELDKNLDILYSNATFSNFSTTTGATNFTTYRIERIAEFLPGGPALNRTFLTDASFDASPSAMKISPYTAGSSKLFLGLVSGKLLRVDNADGTPSWTDITGAGFVGSISDIEFGQNESEIFVTVHNYGVTSVWFSNNGGSTWTSKEGNLPDLPVKCILQNPLIPSEVIIGTELGVWATADYTVASPTWIQAFNGMSDVTVVDLDYRAADDVILATTHGRGLFTSQFTSTTLSITENSFDENTISIYPTVSDGNFTLKTKRAMGDINFTIYDLTGKQVYSDNFEMNNIKKDFNLTLNSGMYLARIESDNSSVTKRIVIK